MVPPTPTPTPPEPALTLSRAVDDALAAAAVLDAAIVVDRDVTRVVGAACVCDAEVETIARVVVGAEEEEDIRDDDKGEI